MARAGRRERRRPWLLGSVAVVVAAGLTSVIVVTVNNRAPAQASGPLPYPNAYGGAIPPPWPAPTDPNAGAQAAGLKVAPMDGPMSSGMQHFHIHLDVVAGGRHLTVPANLGIDTATGAMSGLHTHDTSGVVHIEADQDQQYILGQVFNEWNVKLNRSQVGSLHAGDGRTISAYVNGRKVTGNPAAIELKAHQEIALVFGTPGHKVDVPTRYDFAAGE